MAKIHAHCHPCSSVAFIVFQINVETLLNVLAVILHYYMHLISLSFKGHLVSPVSFKGHLVSPVSFKGQSGFQSSLLSFWLTSFSFLSSKQGE